MVELVQSILSPIVVSFADGNLFDLNLLRWASSQKSMSQTPDVVFDRVGVDYVKKTYGICVLLFFIVGESCTS